MNRLLVLLAVALGALALGAVPSANLGNLVGVDVARGQAAPIDLNCDDSALDDTAVGVLDQTDLGAPLDETNNPPVDTTTPPPAPPCATPAAPAPAVPVAPAPTNAAPPAATAPPTAPPTAPTRSNRKWVRIRVRVGDTVRRIAKRRGHPEDAAAIVKRNKTVKGKRTLRSRHTKLRHGSGASKATRKKDRRKLWVPVH